MGDNPDDGFRNPASRLHIRSTVWVEHEETVAKVWPDLVTQFAPERSATVTKVVLLLGGSVVSGATWRLVWRLWSASDETPTDSDFRTTTASRTMEVP